MPLCPTTHAILPGGSSKDTRNGHPGAMAVGAASRQGSSKSLVGDDLDLDLTWCHALTAYGHLKAKTGVKLVGDELTSPQLKIPYIGAPVQQTRSLPGKVLVRDSKGTNPTTPQHTTMLCKLSTQPVVTRFE
jgi:hypothetical protein